MTGGCAKNAGLVKALGNMLGMEIAPLAVDPQLMGALGAAVLACHRAGNRKVTHLRASENAAAISS